MRFRRPSIGFQEDEAGGGGDRAGQRHAGARAGERRRGVQRERDYSREHDDASRHDASAAEHSAAGASQRSGGCAEIARDVPGTGDREQGGIRGGGRADR
jgi:hypothetical protein